MTGKVIRSISRVIFDSDLVGSRFSLAAGEFAWAVMLLWPGDTFERPTYRHMAAVMAEDCWGMVFLVSAITQFTILLQGDFHSRFARYFAAWNAIVWCFTVWSMLASVYPPPAAIGGEVALAMAAGWIWLRPYVLAEGYKRVREQS